MATSDWPTARELVDGLVDGEHRVTSTTGGQKGTKPQRMDLLPPDALLKLSEVYAFGAQKYADHNYRKGYAWSLSYAALQRHMNQFWAGEDLDPESGLPHVGHAAFHALTLITFMVDHPEFDDRWKDTKWPNPPTDTPNTIRAFRTSSKPTPTSTQADADSSGRMATAS